MARLSLLRLLNFFIVGFGGYFRYVDFTYLEPFKDHHSLAALRSQANRTTS
jgi:hypothetical protein